MMLRPGTMILLRRKPIARLKELYGVFRLESTSDPAPGGGRAAYHDVNGPSGFGSVPTYQEPLIHNTVVSVRSNRQSDCVLSNDISPPIIPAWPIGASCRRACRTTRGSGRTARSRVVGRCRRVKLSHWVVLSFTILYAAALIAVPASLFFVPPSHPVWIAALAFLVVDCGTRVVFLIVDKTTRKVEDSPPPNPLKEA
jgi:hypothetical protein